ncbi:hypothetical protein SteCoe_13325 [Stentor coeruleus]|uniref:Uncharacterized protein n=1 Tax=Stentor coeruleus TaxID=5963 RepID=A0A1R2C8L3_9CILI|nr:hypothetical protein SteCoe_13325 [Stentor coeruleus]
MEDYGSSQGLTNSDLKQSSNIEDFRSSLHNMELKLAKAREDKALVSNKLEEINEHIEQSQKKLSQIEEEVHERNRKIKELEFRVDQSSCIMPQGSVDLMSFDLQLKMKEDQILDLKNLLKKRDSMIESMKKHTVSEEQKLNIITSSAKENKQKAENLKSKLEKTHKSLDSSNYAKRNEETLMVELEHYKADNARLVALLKSTDEFSAFSDFAEASEGIRYMQRGNKVKVQVEEECDDWIPQESWKMVKDFLAKYGEKGFKSVQINRLLEDLNSVWRRREKNLMSQVRSKCNKEIEAVRKQIGSTPKFEQNVAKNEINKLKSGLKKAQEDLRTVSSTSVRVIPRTYGYV